MPRPDPKARLEAVEAVFSALAHPARRNILLAVHFRGGAMTAGEIARRFDHAWPTTTRHLQVLERAGLLDHRKQGRQRVYRIQRARLAVMQEWIAWFDVDPTVGPDTTDSTDSPRARGPTRADSSPDPKKTKSRPKPRTSKTTRRKP